MARRGRPRKQIDEEQFEKLCALQCTEVEIASFFNCNIDTLSDWCVRQYGENFSEIAKKKRQIGKISLRRTQWKMAEKSPVMAIFLGKQYLDQSDMLETTTTIEIADEQRKAVEDFLNDTGAEDITE